jgi:predicted XRE-type DNA-binding protein
MRWCGYMTQKVDFEAVAAHAITQARLLRIRANLLADVAQSQAVALLLDSGMSQRAVAELAGLSKSDVARWAKTRPALGVMAANWDDPSIHEFAAE